VLAPAWSKVNEAKHHIYVGAVGDAQMRVDFAGVALHAVPKAYEHVDGLVTLFKSKLPEASGTCPSLLSRWSPRPPLPSLLRLQEWHRPLASPAMHGMKGSEESKTIISARFTYAIRNWFGSWGSQRCARDASRRQPA
jgi:hypothetical protein